MASEAVPGHLHCQKNSRAYRIRQPVVHVERRQPAAKGDVDGRLIFGVVLADTVCFPEGGGQLADFGWMWQVSSASGGGDHRVDHLEVGTVVDVQNEGGRAVHVVEWAAAAGCSVELWLKEGAMVEVCIDRERRKDLMHQHTAQHLISAIAERTWGAETVSWELRAYHKEPRRPIAAPDSGSMENDNPAESSVLVPPTASASSKTAALGQEPSVRGDRNEAGDPCGEVEGGSAVAALLPFAVEQRKMGPAELCYVDLEFEKKVPENVMADLRARVADAVIADHPVEAQLMTLEDAGKIGAVGRNMKIDQLPRELRAVMIGNGSVDANLCCGTHVGRLGELRSVGLLKSEMLKKGRVMRLSFLAGERLRVFAEEISDIANELTGVVKVPPPQQAAEVSRLQQVSKKAAKVKDGYRRLWLNEKVEKAFWADSGDFRRLSTAGDGGRGEVVLGSLFVEEVESHEEARGIINDANFALKNLKLPACVCGEGASATQQDEQRVLLVMVAPPLGRHFDDGPQEDGAWALIGCSANDGPMEPDTVLKAATVVGRIVGCEPLGSPQMKQGKWTFARKGKGKSAKDQAELKRIFEETISEVALEFGSPSPPECPAAAVS